MSVKVMDLVFDSDVKPANMKFALLALADNAGHTGFCRPGVNHLAAKTGTSRSTMFRLLAQLEAENLIERKERRRANGSRQANAYRINLELLKQRSRIVSKDEEDELEKLFEEESAEVSGIVPDCDGGEPGELPSGEDPIFASSQDETGPWVNSETGTRPADDTDTHPVDDTGKNRQGDRQPDRPGTHATREADREVPCAEDPVVIVELEDDEFEMGANSPGVVLPDVGGAGPPAMVDKVVEENKFNDEFPAQDSDPFSGQDGHPDQVGIDWSSMPSSVTRMTSRYNRLSHTQAGDALVKTYLESAPPMAIETRDALRHKVAELQAQKKFPDDAILEAMPECLAKCHPNALPGFVSIVMARRASTANSTVGNRISETERLREQMRAMDAAEERGQLGHFGMRAIGGGE